MCSKKRASRRPTGGLLTYCSRITGRLPALLPLVNSCLVNIYRGWENIPAYLPTRSLDRVNVGGRHAAEIAEVEKCVAVWGA